MRVALVGVGQMGRAHLRVLQSCGQSVVTIDPNASGADYTNLHDALQAERFDVVCIATPPQCLAWEARVALNADCHVLIEKPLAMDIADAEAIVGLAEERGLQLLVGYTERYNPAVEVLAWALPKVGEIRSISARRLGPYPNRSTAGVLLDMATHDLDVLHYLGLQPVPMLRRVGCWILDADGALVTLEVAHHHACKVRTLTITGERGMLALDYQAQTVDYYGPEGVERLPVTNAEPLQREWEDFLGRLKDGGSLSGASGEDALAALRLALLLSTATAD